MIIKLTPRERIEKVVCWAGLNTSSFATHIGLSSPQTLYQIKSGKHDISRPLAERICNHYPEVDFVWLFTGEGDMLRPQEASIPYYTGDCTEVALGKTHATPSGHINMAGCGDCDFVAPYNSRTMEPEIRQGSLLFCKRARVEELQVGTLCLIATQHTAFVRKVAEITATHILVAASDNTILPTQVERTLIVGLYIIKASLEWKNI